MGFENMDDDDDEDDDEDHDEVEDSEDIDAYTALVSELLSDLPDGIVLTKKTNSDATSSYHGISKAKIAKKFEVRFKHHYLGSYTLEVVAALVYDYSIRAHGLDKYYSKVNFATAQDYIEALEKELEMRCITIDPKDAVAELSRAKEVVSKIANTNIEDEDSKIKALVSEMLMGDLPKDTVFMKKTISGATSSAFHGVSKKHNERKFVARFRHHHLNSFILEADAALSFDGAVRAYGMETYYPKINFDTMQDYMTARKKELKMRCITIDPRGAVAELSRVKEAVSNLDKDNGTKLEKVEHVPPPKEKKSDVPYPEVVFPENEELVPDLVAAKSQPTHSVKRDRGRPKGFTKSMASVSPESQTEETPSTYFDSPNPNDEDQGRGKRRKITPKKFSRDDDDDDDIHMTPAVIMSNKNKSQAAKLGWDKRRRTNTKGGRPRKDGLPVKVSKLASSQGYRSTKPRPKKEYTKSGIYTKRLCEVEGCEKQIQQGGRCCTHGAQIIRNNCGIDGCSNQSKRGGLCRRHGGFCLPLCLQLGCKRVAAHGRYCDAHMLPGDLSDY